MSSVDFMEEKRRQRELFRRYYSSHVREIHMGIKPWIEDNDKMNRLRIYIKNRERKLDIKRVSFKN